MEGEGNEGVHNRYGMSSKGKGMNCGVVEEVICNTLRWFGYIKGMTESDMAKRVYMRMVDAMGTKGQPPVK